MCWISFREEVLLQFYKSSMNLSKNLSASTGPGVASGWNWHEKNGFVEWAMPSFVLSFKLRSQIFQSFGRDFSSTAKPWFWDVMKHWLYVSDFGLTSIQGWFCARWPNLSL